MNSLIITDNLRLNSLPHNVSMQTKNVSPEVVQILYGTSTKDQVNFRFPECEAIFNNEIGSDYTNDNFPRKYMKGDTIIHVSYFKPRKNLEQPVEEKDSLLYRLISIQGIDHVPSK